MRSNNNSLKKLSDLILTHVSKGAKIAVYAANITTGKEFTYNALSEIGTASIIKNAVAITLFRKAEKGEIDLDKVFPLDRSNFFDWGTHDDSLLRGYPEGSPLTLRVCVTLMLAVSDNIGTNVVLAALTKEEVNNFLKEFGFKHTKLTASSINEEFLNDRKNELGKSTAEETFLLMKGLVDNTYLTPEHSQELLSMMSLSPCNDTIHRYLPTQRNYSDAKAEIDFFCQKGGSFPQRDNLRADVAYFRRINPKEEFIFSIFTQNVGDKNYLCDAGSHPSCVFIGDASLLLYEALKS